MLPEVQVIPGNVTKAHHPAQCHEKLSDSPALWRGSRDIVHVLTAFKLPFDLHPGRHSLVVSGGLL